MTLFDYGTDEYIFCHRTDELEVKIIAKDIFTDKIIESFVNFMRACGHYDKCIYESMQEAAEQYFELEEKRTERERQVQPVLD